MSKTQAKQPEAPAAKKPQDATKPAAFTEDPRGEAVPRDPNEPKSPMTAAGITDTNDAMAAVDAVNRLGESSKRNDERQPNDLLANVKAHVGEIESQLNRPDQGVSPELKASFDALKATVADAERAAQA